MGTKTVKVKSRGVSRGRHYSSSQSTGLQGRPLMSLDELMSLKNTDAVMMTEANPAILARGAYMDSPDL